MASIRCGLLYLYVTIPLHTVVKTRLFDNGDCLSLRNIRSKVQVFAIIYVM